MSRPKANHPTPAELEILKILWDHGPLTVRGVLEYLEPKRAYTTVMSLLNVMTEKGLVLREPFGRAFLYRPEVAQESTLKGMLSDLWKRAFQGSASKLVAHLLDQANPSAEELDAIRATLQQFEAQADGQTGISGSAAGTEGTP